MTRALQSGEMVNGQARAHEPERQGDLWLAGRRLAVIDIGSNSIRLLAVELIGNRAWKVLAEERSMTRLAHGLADTGRIAAGALAMSADAITRFNAIAESVGVEKPRAFATAAVREASNREEFVALVRERAGLRIELVSAADEGRLTYRSAGRVYDLTHGWAAVADIGGGSLEVVLSRDGVMTSNVSMPLGAVRLTEQFGGAARCAREEFREMRRHIGRVIEETVEPSRIPPGMFVGCGGTCTTILTLASAARGVFVERNSPALRSAGSVGQGEIKRMIATLRETTLEERLRLPGLPPDRADIAVAGFTVIERLMARLGAAHMYAHPGGFREGLLLRMIEQEAAGPKRSARGAAGTVAPKRDRLEGVRALAARCGYQRAHSEHVAGLAVSLYDQALRRGAVKDLGKGATERELLEAAGVLHDVGVMVEYRRHHKHSAEIIRQAGLESAGFTAREVEIVAQVSRYHRRAIASEDHREFAALTAADRGAVRRLSGLLRVADGLDHDHSQCVTGARLLVRNGAIRVEVASEGDAEANLKASRKKADALEEVVGGKVEIVAARLA